MRFENRNALWGSVVADELAKAGVDAVCLAPGSRCTPLTVAFAEHPGIETYSHLDERAAAFFALGRAKRTGRPTPVVCTSGTAAANVHPAVIEAHQSRAPMLLLTADRPRVLQHSGANQTVDQEGLYGDAVRHYRTLPEPEADGRKLRALRTALDRAVATATGVEPGPVHLNVPFEKPLEPTPVPGDVPEGFAASHREAVEGRDGPFVSVAPGAPELSEADLRDLVEAVERAERGLIVAGPTADLAPEALAALAAATGFPVLADPLSGLRFGPHVADATVCGGYDSYLDALDAPPDLALRFGASPTSKTLREYLRDATTASADARQVVVDPAGGWREATFTATDLAVADPTRLARALAGRIEGGGDPAWRERFAALERDYWSLVEGDWTFFEGAILADAAALAPDPSTLFVSNSMPVRDLDRFGRPREAAVTALGNRGASGIDGITSSALGAGSAADDPLVLVTGDLAYYHDSNGLLAVGRCGVDATIVLVNNDGGGIFRMLPIESHDPPFTEFFRTPHGLDFEPTADLYGLEFSRVETREGFREAYRDSLERAGTQVIEVRVDSEASHRHREVLHERVASELSDRSDAA
ncbi:2-succinyl-5-enolpyruvyl-6-hydroxy-3-cyclohexene-1-carboxylic-acid synthase [Halomarina pelagica]|uniref:2-succinyl-5-enolpyruvyl-6-hydroxy-3- cyclohexene-1-carboxylic-acid synthase n=1 Tax=Halomarina pelagica TaxID=2961599 RepID=UPI0020C3B33D|nr:2-succinyl-5-enolpyruvyl-6-hydroxy-3-cyclohexene-1-carboxylic-acid synthase [Halomarina sp. BND7]